MNTNYEKYLAKCRAPKRIDDVERILSALIAGVKAEMNSTTLAAKMNAALILSLVGKAWTRNSVQMSILSAVRFQGGSLSYVLAKMLQAGKVTRAELELLRTRCRLV